MINFERVQQNIVRLSHQILVYSVKHFSYGISIREDKVDNLTASSNYWSSSVNVSNSSNAWNVNFSNGNTNNNNKTNKYYVRCVRAGQ